MRLVRGRLPRRGARAVGRLTRPHEAAPLPVVAQCVAPTRFWGETWLKLLPLNCLCLRMVYGALANQATARNAEPVDPAIRTTHKGQSIVECVLLTGT